MITLKHKQQTNAVRIIAGKWRGRKIQFPDSEGLRPTPDRVRETLFNWVQAHVGGAMCLDLFAGSGALGLEALSRGAEYVTLVETAPLVAKQLQIHLIEMQASNIEVKQMTAQGFLEQCQQQFDLVFIDPPYQLNLWTDIAKQLDENDLLRPHALIYLECPSKQPLPMLPSSWHQIKDKKAGDVRYCLFEVEK